MRHEGRTRDRRRVFERAGEYVPAAARFTQAMRRRLVSTMCTVRATAPSHAGAPSRVRRTRTAACRSGTVSSMLHFRS